MDKFRGLKAIAEKAKELGGINNYKKGKDAGAAFQAAATPTAILALLAELEAKTKHIADMEHVVAAAKCDDELWDAMAHRLKTLEAKLATPVRLGAGVLMVSAYSANSCDSEWHLCLALDSVVSAIRAAGFTVEGE